MSMLPLRANLEWLKKLCKERLEELRAENPDAQLSDAQLAVANELDFPSWRKLKDYIDQLRSDLAKLSSAPDDEPHAAPDDPELAKLFAAVHAGDANAAIELLQRRPILARSHAADGQTALHLSARYNDPKLCLWLLAYGANPEAKFGESGHTVLSWAVTCNASEFAKMLVRLSALKPDLYSAAGLGLIDSVRAWFDPTGQLLPCAATTGSSRFAADGTRLPCPPETATEQISDALVIACRNAQLEVVRFLLTKQPDLAFRAFYGGTPLHWAYFGGSSAVVELLIGAGADQTLRDSVLHCTPRAFGIAVATSWGIDFIVRKLLASDSALVNHVDAQTSPLHEAARAGHVNLAILLLACGADPAFRNSAGKTARDVAIEGGHAAVAELFPNPSG
jgi:ankyrin repeat protein